MIQQTTRAPHGQNNKEFFDMLSNLKQSSKKRKVGQMSSQIKKQSQIYLHKRSATVVKKSSSRTQLQKEVLPQIHHINNPSQPATKLPPNTAYKPTHQQSPPGALTRSPKLPISQDSSLIAANLERSASMAKNVRNSSVSEITARSTKSNYSYVAGGGGNSTRSSQPQRQPSRGSNQNNNNRRLQNNNQNILTRKLEEAQRRLTNLGAEQSRVLAYASPQFKKPKPIEPAPPHESPPLVLPRQNKIFQQEQQKQAYQVDQPPSSAYNDDSIVQLQRRVKVSGGGVAGGQMGSGGTFESSTMTGGGLSMLVGANLSTYFMGSEHESLEDMHGLFVAFYQKKRALLQRIEKNAAARKKPKQLSSSGIMIQDGIDPSSTAQISAVLRKELSVLDLESQEEID